MKPELLNSLEQVSSGVDWISSKLTIAHLIASGTIVTATASVAATNDTSWKVTAFLAIGTSLGVFWSYLTMTRAENRKKIAARVIIGAMGGIGLPLLLDEGLQWWKGYKLIENLHPFLVILSGFPFAVLSYYVLHAWARSAEPNQEALGAALGNVTTSILRKKLGAQLPETKDERGKDDCENPADRG